MLKNKKMTELLEVKNTREYQYNEERESEIIASIHRYKFTQLFMDELYKFSKVHQYDERKLFKESWTIWIEESHELIKNEEDRITKLGYEGDVLDKMFKSARYYFRKKSNIKNEPKERRKYVSLNKEILEEMDKDILRGLNNKKFKPSEGFDNFCEKNTDLIKKEIELLLDKKIESEDILLKIKKTYKNRYFMLISK
jgi:hypothetical protein